LFPLDNGHQNRVRRKSNIRKESIIAEILAKRGWQPGLVHILSAMECSETYKPWHNKQTHKTYLVANSGKCLHYYFYFIDEALGLCYARAPTWCPFCLQFYFNGHNWLAAHLRQQGIGYELPDNAFSALADLAAAQKLADKQDAKQLRERLDHYAQLCCPARRKFGEHYHWSLSQVEFATDIIFKRADCLGPVYEGLDSGSHAGGESGARGDVPDAQVERPGSE